MHIRGEINLSTRSESLKKKKYSRKEKHKNAKNHWVKLLMAILPSGFLKTQGKSVVRLPGSYPGGRRFESDPCTHF